MLEGHREDFITFDPKTKTLCAGTYSYEISSSGYCELDEKETKTIYEEMRRVFENETKI